MWCSNCGQDVPGIASKKPDGGILCARCGTRVGPAGEEPAGRGPVHLGEAEFSANPPPIDLDDWETEEDLRRADMLVGRIRGQTGRTDSAASHHVVDGPHAAVRDWHAHLRARMGRREPDVDLPAARPHRRRRVSAWPLLTMSLGVVALVCGAALLIWGHVEGRNDLWSLGLPITIGGQAVLLLGVVLQLHGLWCNTRETSESLDELDENLADLKHATTLLGTTHSSAAQSFYLHMAEGASPELMLADLKGQLDMLTLRLARQRD